jgi:hypothetical protein
MAQVVFDDRPEASWRYFALVRAMERQHRRESGGRISGPLPRALLSRIEPLGQRD